MQLQKFLRSNHFLSLSGSFFSAFLGFIGFGILARYLTKDENGAYLLFLTSFTFLEMLRTGLLNTALIKHLSGVNDPHKHREIAGGTWRIALIFTAVVSGLSLLAGAFLHDRISSHGYQLFFRWFALTYLLTLPFHYAGWYLSAISAFGKLLIARLVNLLVYVGFLIWNALYSPTAESAVLSYLGANAVTSLVCVIAGWCAVKSIGHSKKASRKELLGFGKFSMMTLVGSNLLRSSDTFIIEAMLGPQAVSIYTIPQKLVEVIEIPVRSIISSALPQLSAYQNEGKKVEFNRALEQFTGILTISILPLCAILFALAEPLVVLVGGEDYRDSSSILRILAIYTLFLPFDRFTGVTFDVLNKPKINTLKVFVMLTVNIVGDIVALKLTNDVWWVAIVSIATFLSGVIFGVGFLQRFMPFSMINAFRRGFTDFSLIINKIRKK